MALFLNKECLKEAKILKKKKKKKKKGTKFIIRDTAQCIGEHTEKQFV